MSNKNEKYRMCCEEIMKICDLFPGFSVSKFIKEEEIDISNAPLLLSSLKEFRQRLELDNHIIQNDEETQQIIDEGMRIHSILIKQQMYGED